MTPAYPPIADCAVIGNLRTTAVLTRDGRVVWWCVPELQHGSVFAALLDHRCGGAFRVSPRGWSSVSRAYAGRTAVLVTTYACPAGDLTVTDFMPIRGSIAGCTEADAPPQIHRLLRCDQGRVEVEVEWAPRFDYARAPAAVARRDGRFVARAGGETLSLAGLDGEIVDGPDGPSVRGAITLTAGREAVLVTWYGAADRAVGFEQSRAALGETGAAWRGWMDAGNGGDAVRAWTGVRRALVDRSAIVLKMLTHPHTGGIAAAPTTSLPESIGGVRNWDYRYAWIRDASFTVQALLAIGHAQEAKAFVEFAERAAMEWSKGHHEIALMYDLHGGHVPDEEELPHLEGYLHSRPVRIGNGARDQVQHDVYGELIDCAYQLLRRGGALAPEVFPFLARMADRACAVWREPDDGIWEFRAEPRHFTYSKVMVWVALDRAVRLADGYGLTGDVARWRRTRDEVRDDVIAHGYDAEIGSFVIAYGSKELDAANLRIPLLEFLPASDPRVQGTIDRALERLTQHDLVFRYRLDDGLSGHEGAFGLCTFWLCEALALSGRRLEARRVFDGMAARANDVGLYAEEIDPQTGAFLGNFPQAFTHIGLINAALYLAAAEGEPVRALEGAPAP
jgi:GH15 family glucan-1,4-alpha-glucosidase